ncbi:hypothetical protein BKA63DRAFT_419992 [Paraphoma chrysanthemicola]|nr:hypothetical protein BKA63DRAFT_419992 [Paraphoma chrysanthemicola]
MSFAFVGVLAWGVMVTIAEMVSIWPLSLGDMSAFITDLVDVELGVVVGVVYWLTYVMFLAALVAAGTAIAKYSEALQSVPDGLVLGFVLACLVAINVVHIQSYAWFGCLKIFLLASFACLMVFIQIHGSPESKIGAPEYENAAIIRDREEADSKTRALLRLSVVTLGFIGVDIIAMVLSEDGVPRNRNSTYSRGAQRSSGPARCKSPFWNTTSLIGLGTPMYVLVSDLHTCHRQNDVILPRISWWTASENEGLRITPSIFMVATEASIVPKLVGCLNVLLVFMALTSADMALYIASRSLFNLTRSLNGSPGNSWYVRFLAYFGRTNQRHVPLRAIVASCIAAGLILCLASDHMDVNVGNFFNTLARVSSTGIIIVWACECWAFVRLYRLSFDPPLTALSLGNSPKPSYDVPDVSRWIRGRTNVSDQFPYRSRGQPYIAYASLIACIFILVVANGANLWAGFKEQTFDIFTAYLGPACFLVSWALLKLLRNSPWKLVNISERGESIGCLPWSYVIDSNDSESDDKEESK